MVFDSIKTDDAKYLMHTYGRNPVAIKEGRNARCRDFDGKEYIDFTSGIGVNSLGFCDGGWVRAVTEQLGLLQHISNLYYTTPCIAAAKQLCGRTGMERAFFANSGAEANECAIKGARKYSFIKYGPGRDRIVTLNNSFHGRTVTTLAATGQEVFHNYFFPFTEGFDFADAEDIPALEKLLGDGRHCALMLELIQGEGGVVPLSREYVSAAAKLCAENDVLLLVDEVQTGVGRTGSLYCFQQFGIEPDIVTSAKGIGGGLPLSAALFAKSTAEVFSAGDHATTFGANPVACAGCVEILNRLDDAMLSDIREKGAYMTGRILEMPGAVSVSGMGLMLGITLDEGINAADVAAKGIGQGVLLLTAKTKVRLLPPLTITRGEMDDGLAALEKALAEAAG